MRWFGLSQLRTSALTESAGADAKAGAAATSAPARASRPSLRCYAAVRRAAVRMRMRDHLVKPSGNCALRCTSWPAGHDCRAVRLDTAAAATPQLWYAAA